MGVSIPMSSAKPLQWVQRWGLLVAFAIFNQHTRPYSLGASPTNAQWGIGLIAFGLTLLMFGKWKWGRIGGFLAGGTMLALLTYPDGSGFQKERGDIIILVLGAAGFFGTAIWHLTRRFPWLRLSIGFVAMGIRLVDWQIPALGWFFQPAFLGYLGIILPATLVGEWIKDSPLLPEEVPEVVRWVGFVCAPWSLVVLFSRWPAALVLLPLTALLFVRSSISVNLRRFLLLAVGTLALGAALEPWQGGIKKDPPTFE